MGNTPFVELIVQICNLIWFVVDRRQSMWSEGTHQDFHRRVAKITALARDVEEVLYHTEEER